MDRTLQISFSLKNTYRVNSILYSLKQIPLVRNYLPDALYQARGLKIFANVLSVIWEVLTVFLGKLIYFLTMICGIGLLYENVPKDQLFLHLLFFLTMIGAFVNNNLFNPSRDKYYAMILMRMNARKYTLINYGYSIFKVVVGFLPFTLLFGRMNDISLFVCLLLPFSIAGLKLTVAAVSLWDYEIRGFAYNENLLSKLLWIGIAAALAMAYGLPALGLMLPVWLSELLMLVFIPAGLIGIIKIVSFKKYKEINKELLAQTINQMDMAVEISKKDSEKAISADTSITSGRRGFEYLNELFIRRHQKILWKATKRISCVCIFAIVGVFLLMYLAPEKKEGINQMLMTSLPYFIFIMYAINRGAGFTKALFMNCDHSLLNYSFFKQPDAILKLFRLRLWEIMKVNAVPALIIGTGLALILFASGGTETPLNYAVMIISILCMSIFFSVHYLMIYYLLQPYNAGTEIKSGTYQIVTSGTYIVCYLMMRLKIPTLLFCVMMIIFCVLYSAVACVLVYRFAPKTFRFRI